MEEYYDAEDLMKEIKNLKRYKANEYIKEAQRRMKDKNMLVPTCKPMIASKKILIDMFKGAKG